MNMWEVFRFELAYQLRQPSTWIYLLVLLVLGLLRADATDVGIVHYHAPVQAAGSMLMVGMLATLITAGLFVEAGVRDVHWRIDPLVYTTPLRARDYLGGRFLGTLLVNALLLLAIPAGLLLGIWLPAMSAETLGPFRLEAYLLPYLVFLLPNLLVNAAILFGVTVLSRRSLPGYLGALGLTAVYLFAGLTAGADSSRLAALVDPMGAVALVGLTEGWTRVEQSTRFVGLEGILLWNRLLWMTLGAGMLAFTCRRFRFVHAEPASRRGTRQLAPALVPEATRHEKAVVVPLAPRSFSFRAHVYRTAAMAWFAFRQTGLSREFLVTAIGLLAFALLMLLGGPVSGRPVWPLTQEVTADLTSWVIQVLIALLTAFYAGELVWRERDDGLAIIGDAIPLPDWVLMVGKLFAVGGLLVVLQVVLMAAGMLAQALQGYYRFEPELYLLILFGLQLPKYLLFAVLAFLTHVVVNQKYVGHVVSALLFVGLLQARRLGIEHNLLVYGSDPGWIYSDLNGLGPFVEPFVWFKLYWSAWAFLLGVVALLLWVRGTENGLRGRLRLARQRFTPRIAGAAAAASLLIVTTGGFIFYNTNIVNEYFTTWDADERQAEYERRYKRFEDAEQPWLTSIRLHAELYPERREATVRGTYRLVNWTEAPIDSLHLSSVPHPKLTLRQVRFDRSAALVLEDTPHGYRIYALERALQAGDSLQMHFELAVMPRGYRNREHASLNTLKVGDFTNLGSWLLPAIGYQRRHELSSARARREHALAPSEVRPSIHDRRARRIPRIPQVHFEGTVGTSLNQFAILPGTLQREWTKGNRRYFNYRAQAPILNFFSLLSAEYAAHHARWRSPSTDSAQAVEIRVLHHPNHSFNLEHLVRSAQASLDYLTEEFGPYPHGQLWIVEVPRYGRGIRAYAGQIVYSERSPVTLARVDDQGANRIDGPLLATAHELAHQWWGQQVMGADVQGSQMLSETLAQYSAAMVLQRTHGAGHAHRFLQEMHGRYLARRGRHETPEAPLLLTTDHEYIHYGKGAVVMYALQDYLGEEQVNTALRRFVEDYRFSGPSYPTTLDLYRELQAVTPDSLQYLLEDLLATITLWDLRAAGARAEPTGTGDYCVTLDVEAVKLRSDGIGNETDVAMDDWVEIGVFAEGGEPLYLRKHRIRSGKQTITLAVPGKPARAGIDPYRKLITRHVEGLANATVKVAEVLSALASCSEV
jgi:ABC-2 type transport system permease protein